MVRIFLRGKNRENYNLDAYVREARGNFPYIQHERSLSDLPKNGYAFFDLIDFDFNKHCDSGKDECSLLLVLQQNSDVSNGATIQVQLEYFYKVQENGVEILTQNEVDVQIPFWQNDVGNTYYKDPIFVFKYVKRIEPGQDGIFNFRYNNLESVAVVKHTVERSLMEENFEAFYNNPLTDEDYL